MKNINTWLIIAIVILVLLLLGQCRRASNMKQENERLENNILASQDTIHNYKDKYGNSVAEIRAYQLKQDELEDSLKLTLKKNKELISYINTSVGVRDTIYVNGEVIRDSVIIDIDPNLIVNSGNILIKDSTLFGKSSRNLSIITPYYIDTLYDLKVNESEIILNQDIFVEGYLDIDKKTKQTFLTLKTDYEGVNFNSGMGVICTESKALKKQNTKHIGIGVGLQLGYGICGTKLGPYVGLGIGIQYSPKFLQF